MDRACNLIYYFATRNSDEEGRNKFDRALYEAGALTHDQAEHSAGGQGNTVVNGREMPPRPAWYGVDGQASDASRSTFDEMSSPPRRGSSR